VPRMHAIALDEHFVLVET